MDRRDFLIHSTGTLAGAALLPSLELAGPRRLREPRAVAVVGIGRQGRQIVQELSQIEGARVTAVCDTDPERLKAAVERTPGVEGFADHRALLDRRKEIGAVIIATPTHLHRAIVDDCLRGGRHVYCEAPLAHTAEEARAIADAAATAEPGKVLFQSGFQGRSNPVYQLARSFFRSGAVRDLVSMQAQFHRKTSWRFPGAAANWRLDPAVTTGLAGEVGAQQFDVCAWFRGRLPVSVAGRGAIRLHNDGRRVPDTIHTTLLWDDGVALDYEATLANSYGGQFEQLHGTNAAIKLAWSHAWMFKEADAPTQGWEVYATRQQFHNDEGIVLIADATKLAAQGALKKGMGLPYTGLYYALGDFLKSIEEAAPPRCTAQDGLRATVLGILANQAVTTGQQLAVPAGL
ncbi:MAG: Gfo/Idh/MocA family oxidoreductase [Gemmatimonadales bacterium]|nr:Gfo/Idh/MocA family oxidoreductase [Gemmatimonadales bacterium]